VILAAGMAVSAGSIPLRAQQTAQRDQPVFRVGVPGVDVDARVFDRDGRFVDSLTIGDFELLENGVPQTLQALTLVGGTSPPASGPPEISGTVAPRPAPPASARQTWIFFFDLNHLTSGGGFDRARSAVETYLRDQFSAGDIGGVVAGSRMVNNRLTSVREELVAAARSVKPLSDHRSRTMELTREWPRLRDESEALLIANGNREALQRAVIRACTDDPSACRVASPDMTVMDKARRFEREASRATSDTLAAINAVASGLARMPGPKTIVFLSDGFVTEKMETTLESVVGQTARAGARIYAVDVRGLNRGAAAGLGDRMSPDDPAGGPARFDMGEDGPNSLAVDTGGFVIRNENDIGRALAQIASDANRYYVLSYQPADSRFDGKFRTIEVRVRRPGIKVRARKGYLALDPSRMITPSASAPIGATADKPPVPSFPTLPPVPPPPSVPPSLPSASASASAPVGATADKPPALRIRPDATNKALDLAGGDLARTDALSADGWKAYERGDVEAAIAPLTQAAAQPDVRPWVLYVLGLSHAALDHSAEAIAAWERVRSAAPQFAPVYFDLAAVYGQRSDLTNALSVLRQAETRWPEDATVHNAIGVILSRRGALDDAIKAFDKARTNAPEDPVAYLNLGRAYEMRYTRNRRYIASQQRWVAPEGDRQKAIEYFQRYVDLKGPHADQAIESIGRLKWGGA
jgi:VWFA-related protein